MQCTNCGKEITLADCPICGTKLDIEPRIKTTFENGFFWNNYKTIESTFLDYLSYVPYCSPNRTVYSPKLVGILLQIGGYIDSAFKEMVKYEIPDFCGKSVSNIEDAWRVFEPVYKLSNNFGGDLIAILDYGDKQLYPFKEFSNSVYTPLPWWQAYNEVKHQYSPMYFKARMETVLEGLSAAFLLNVIHYPGTRLLWELEYLKTCIKTSKGFNEIFLSKEYFGKYMTSAVSNLKPLKIGIRVETDLFLYSHV